MKVIYYSEAEARRFDSDAAKGVTGRILIGKSDGANHFCMRVFELDPNGYSPRHRHEWEHEIFIHSGHGEVLRQGEWMPIMPGYAIFIPGNEEHQIRNTGKEPLVFICLIPSGVPEL